MMKARESDAARIVGVVLMLIGCVAASVSLALAAIQPAWGRPGVERPVVALVIGAASVLVGYRMASREWSGAGNAVHHAAALGGLLFLGTVLYTRIRHNRLPPFERIVPYAVLSLALPGSWWWRARRRSRASRIGTERTNANMSGTIDDETGFGPRRR